MSRRCVGIATEGEWSRVRWKYERPNPKDLPVHVQAAKYVEEQLKVQTYEAGVSPVRRLITDYEIAIDKPRRCFMDLETDSRVPFSQKTKARILAWSVVDEAGKSLGQVLKDDTDEDERRLLIDLWTVLADFDQLNQVFTNMILNAVQAMPDGGKLVLRNSATDGDLRIDFIDTGRGISPENMRKLFTPFFTTKPEVKGVGLGLAISYGIIQRHRGRIEVQSQEGKGTTFSIFIPRNAAPVNGS